ncbi:hypothetical protein KY290_007008 [Solanum tuberosum]|uniref:Transmembrane protein n=1 Tax=Solanum tuberosum TaxID=4113 RepID=A0ABQ7W4B8_SOLTU|nr:hypothetical protein KY290_007008 [Solanum tuberosum]
MGKGSNTDGNQGPINSNFKNLSPFWLNTLCCDFGLIPKEERGIRPLGSKTRPWTSTWLHLKVTRTKIAEAQDWNKTTARLLWQRRKTRKSYLIFVKTTCIGVAFYLVVAAWDCERWGERDGRRISLLTLEKKKKRGGVGRLIGPGFKRNGPTLEKVGIEEF